MRNKVLTDEEIKKFKSMSNYWQEVRRRPEQSILQAERGQVAADLGLRLLSLVEHYVEMIEEKQDAPCQEK